MNYQKYSFVVLDWGSVYSTKVLHWLMVDGLCGGSGVATSQRFVVGLSSCVRFINPSSPFKLSRAFDAEDSGYLGVVDFLPTKHSIVFSDDISKIYVLSTISKHFSHHETSAKF